MKFRGVIWITGASAGIGRSVALELVRRGYQVAATARRAEELAKLESESANIFAYPGDITDAQGIKALIDRIEAERGAIALAFLNAGVYFIEERQKFDASIVRHTFEVNVGGTVNCLEPLIKAMSQRGQGHIAINASLAGYSGLPRSSGYAPSKAALINIAEGLALTYAEQKLKIQIVNPGFVRTAMTAKNDFFEMPFLMSPEEAAKRICDGFENHFSAQAGSFFQSRPAFALSLISTFDAARNRQSSAKEISLDVRRISENRKQPVNNRPVAKEHNDQLEKLAKPSLCAKLIYGPKQDRADDDNKKNSDNE